MSKRNIIFFFWKRPVISERWASPYFLFDGPKRSFTSLNINKVNHWIKLITLSISQITLSRSNVADPTVMVTCKKFPKNIFSKLLIKSCSGTKYIRSEICALLWLIPNYPWILFFGNSWLKNLTSKFLGMMFPWCRV